MTKKLNKKTLYEMMTENDPLIAYLYVDARVSFASYYSFIALYDSLNFEMKNEKSNELYQLDYYELLDEKMIKNINRLTVYGLIEK